MGTDGLHPHTHKVNESLFWTDMLTIVAALGCVISSMCTVLVRPFPFFFSLLDFLLIPTDFLACLFLEFYVLCP